MVNASIGFAIALAPDWQQVDLLAPEARRRFDGAVARTLSNAARGGEHARFLMLRSLFAATPGGEPLAAGLAVTLAEPSTPVSSEPLGAEAFDGDVSAVMLPAGAGLRIRHVLPADVLVGGTALEMLRVQFLIETALGLLTITFTTPQASRTDEWEDMFDAMAATAELTSPPGEPARRGPAVRPSPA